MENNPIENPTKEEDFILSLWERVWPESSFKNKEEWLGYCRKWWPRLPSLLAALENE